MREKEREEEEEEEEDEEEDDQFASWDKIDLQKSGSDHPPDDVKLLIFWSSTVTEF